MSDSVDIEPAFRRLCRTAVLAAACVACGAARAWGPDGHRTVGLIAAKLLAGSHAAVHVKALLGGLALEDAAVWADCAKGIAPAPAFTYAEPGRYPECKVFESSEAQAEMADFVRRNDSDCARQPHDESCHKRYHYSDVAVQRRAYSAGSAGARSDDVVAAVAAAIQVLKGQLAPAPFNIKDPREALLLLAHWVGDLHQPLHVGVVYLAANGARVDPDAGRFDSATGTRGGNQIVVIEARKDGLNLHRTWDELPPELGPAHVGAAWIAEAGAVIGLKDDPAAWPAVWAGDSLGQARRAFGGLRFGPEQDGRWTIVLPPSYAYRMNAIKKRQLTLAGAHLAQVLRAVWP